MDLFVVNRFWGDGNQELNHSLKERNQINNLLKKIEARKKQKHRENASESGKGAVLVEDPTHETETSDTQVISEEQGTENNLANFDDGDINCNFKCENETIVTETLGLEGNSGENLINEISVNAEATKDFTIIGSDSFKSRIKATHKLPSWLENPVTIPVDLSKKKNLKKGFLLDQKLIKILKENKIKYFFPVQEKVIPWLLKSNSRCLYHWPRDICVSAPTGSGKTLAFVLPIIQALMGRLIPEIRALVVLPVAELAKQVGAVFHQYCSGTGLKVTVAVGGGTPFFKEHSLLVKTNDLVGCQTDILVTTPGRLVAHLRADSGHSLAESTSHHSPSISLGYLQFLVVDEADRVAEGSQNDWLSHLMHHMEHQLGLASSLLPPSVSTIRKYHRHPHRPPQKLLFSATLSKDPEKLRSLFLFQPKLFSTPPEREDDETREERAVVPTTYTTPKELSEEYIIAGDGESGKPLVLLWLLQQRLQGESSAPKALVFTNSRRSSSRLALLLSHMPWDETAAKPSHLSADLPLRDRETILRNFLENRINVLVCSDALARGIDIPQVDLVISYDPPRHMTNHIHRIGRTGRAGRHGCAITILTPNQLSRFSNMVSGGSSMGNAKEVTACLKSLNSLRDKYQSALAAMERVLEEERIKSMKNKRKMNDDNRKPSAMKKNFKRMKSNVNCQQ